jgi:hypothetical protein
MKHLLTSIAILAFASAPGVLAQHEGHGDGHATTIAGNWELSFNSPHGVVKGAFKLQQDGTKITGNCDLEGMPPAPITGKIDGHTVALVLELHGGEMKMTLNGKLDGETMSGTTDPPGGSWTAARPKG